MTSSDQAGMQEELWGCAWAPARADKLHHLLHVTLGKKTQKYLAFFLSIVEVKFALMLEHTILYLKLSMMDSNSEKSLQKNVNLQLPAFHIRANRTDDISYLQRQGVYGEVSSPFDCPI